MLKHLKIVLLLCFSLLCASERDIQILTEALTTDPDNPDYLFHLAKTYHNLKQYSDAIYWFKMRVEKGGDKEQLWTSRYQIAQCYEQLNTWNEAVYWYLEAFQTNPGYLEPLLNLATYYRLHGENDLAYLFAKHGSRFLPSLDYHFDQELSIVSYYTRFKEDGYKACSDLLLRKDAPWDVKQQAYQNLLYYCHNLKNTRFQPIAVELPPIVEESEEKYHPMNPSICKTETGYRVICRSVNYTQKGAKEFYTIDYDGYFRTRNFLLEYTKDFQLLSQQEILEDLPRDKLTVCNVLGLEDARLFEYNGAPWFTCTTRDNTFDGIPQISLCKIGPDASVQSMLLLQGPDPYRCEKNWLPFIHNGELHVVYSYDPFTIYKPDMYTGECLLELCYQPTHDFSSFRGSAGPVAFDNGYLILVHEVMLLADHSRCYLHRFLLLDQRFFIKQVSKPFTFLHQGIEFCGSMTLDHAGGHLILPIGIEDNKAYLCFVDLKTIRSLLTPLQPNL